VTSSFCLPKEERRGIIRSLKKGYQGGIIKANRGSLKAKAIVRLERLEFKKDENARLCDVRCGMSVEHIKIEPCRSRRLRYPRAQHGSDLKACAEALRYQNRVGMHVYKTKASGLSNTGRGSSKAAVQRLVVELRAVVVGAPPRSPAPTAPYPARAVHRAPAAEVAAFQIKHLAAISATLVEVVAVMADGAFKAPRRRAGRRGNATGPRGPCQRPRSGH